MIMNLIVTPHAEPPIANRRMSRAETRGIRLTHCGTMAVSPPSSRTFASPVWLTTPVARHLLAL
jgi:hypothetical protein